MYFYVTVSRALLLHISPSLYSRFPLLLVVITCEDLGNRVINGAITYSTTIEQPEGRYQVGTTATVTCDTGFNGGGITACEMSGSWSPYLPTCEESESNMKVSIMCVCVCVCVHVYECESAHMCRSTLNELYMTASNTLKHASGIVIYIIYMQHPSEIRPVATSILTSIITTACIIMLLENN